MEEGGGGDVVCLARPLFYCPHSVVSRVRRRHLSGQPHSWARLLFMAKPYLSLLGHCARVCLKTPVFLYWIRPFDHFVAPPPKKKGVQSPRRLSFASLLTGWMLWTGVHKHVCIDMIRASNESTRLLDRKKKLSNLDTIMKWRSWVLCIKLVIPHSRIILVVKICPLL